MPTASQVELSRLARETGGSATRTSPQVLGLPARALRGVRRLALRAYKEDARYTRPPTASPPPPAGGVAGGHRGRRGRRVAQAWRDSGQAMIVVAGHVGNNEAVAAAIAELLTRPTSSPTTRRSRSCSSCSAEQLLVVGRPRHPVAQPAGAVHRAPGARRSCATLGHRPDACSARGRRGRRFRDARGEDRRDHRPLAIRRTPHGHAPGIEAHQALTVPSSGLLALQRSGDAGNSAVRVIVRVSGSLRTAVTSSRVSSCG